MRRWSGVIAREGEQTGDGRVWEDGAFVWEPDDNGRIGVLRWDIEDDGAHLGSVAVGTVDLIERRPGGIIWGGGDIDDAGEYGAEVVRLLRAGLLSGVSVDGDDVSVAVIDTTVTEADLAEAEAELEALFAAAGDSAPGPDVGVVLFQDESGTLIEKYSRTRIRAVTLVDIPAFADAQISLDDTDPEAEADAVAEPGDAVVEDGALVAADPDNDNATGAADAGCGCAGVCGSCNTQPAAPTVIVASEPPPPELFERPALDQPTPITVTDTGLVFGDVARHDTCHTGLAGCVTAPYSTRGYVDFHRYDRTSGGVALPVAAGRITGGHGSFTEACVCCAGNDDHACRHLSLQAAIGHHDRLSTLAYVRAGEDPERDTIWVAGIVAPEATDRDRALLSRRMVSGDWRQIAGALELVEVLALAREKPGFPIALAAAGGRRPVSLTGAGMVLPDAGAVAGSGLSAADAERIAARAGQAAVEAWVAREREKAAAAAARDRIEAAASGHYRRRLRAR